MIIFKDILKTVVIVIVGLLLFYTCEEPTNKGGGDIYGCTDPEATNYNPEATVDDGSCEYPPADVYGCTDPEATNYNPEATVDDGSCEYPPADVVGIKTGMAWNWYDTNVTMQFRLVNQGGTGAYNVRYRLEIIYKCAGQITGPTTEFLNFTTCCDLEAGESVDLEDEVLNLCLTNGGLIQFNFEVYQIFWN